MYLDLLARLVMRISRDIGKYRSPSMEDNISRSLRGPGEGDIVDPTLDEPACAVLHIMEEPLSGLSPTVKRVNKMQLVLDPISCPNI